MYTYGIDRKADALKHVLDQGGDIQVALGDVILSWDDIYGCVNEHRGGILVARHTPEIDYESWDGQRYGVKSWSSKGENHGTD